MNSKLINDLQKLRGKLLKLEFLLYQDTRLTEPWLSAQECAGLAGEVLLEATIPATPSLKNDKLVTAFSAAFGGVKEVIGSLQERDFVLGAEGDNTHESEIEALAEVLELFRTVDKELDALLAAQK